MFYIFSCREIAELPESTEVPIASLEKRESLPAALESDEGEYYIANYPYQSIEQGDLSFNAGDIITIIKKEGDWWTGKLKDAVGIFPSNYVQKFEGVCIVQHFLNINQQLPVFFLFLNVAFNVFILINYEIVYCVNTTSIFVLTYLCCVSVLTTCIFVCVRVFLLLTILLMLVTPKNHLTCPKQITRCLRSPPKLVKNL